MDRSKKKILLVEDEDNIALALGILIGQKGFETTRVSTGPEAVAALQADRPDLVVLDVQLPGCSGFEVLQTVRESEDLCDIRVLMMSAGGGEVARKKCLALGGDVFMMKPFSTVELTGEICRLLGEPVDG